MSWISGRLGDILVVKRGQNITKKEAKEGIYPVSLGGREPAYYIDRFNHTGKAIVVSRSGASAGYISFWNEPIFVTDGFLIEPKDDVSYEYLYYLMKYKQGEFHNAQRGAAIPHVTPALITGIAVDIAPKKIQKHIAGILSAYDNLIENNRKQIKLLEEAAQRLYKQWFIDFKFPGHETTRIVDGLPEGWKKERLVDLASVQFGYAFDGSLFNSNGNGTPIVRIRNIPDGVTNDYTTENAPDEYLINNGDIVVGMDGEFHINSWSGETSYLVQRSCCFKPHNPKMKGWLLWAIHDPIKFFEKTVVGATVAHLGKKHIDTIELLVGLEKLYEPFQNLFSKRQTLLNQNRKLAEARDRLLPKLMCENTVCNMSV